MKLDTHEGVLRFCELRRAEMVRCWERMGRFEENGFSSAAYVFATRGFINKDFETEKLDHVEGVLVRIPKFVNLLPAGEHTRLFGHVIREYVKKTAAIGTLLMAEAWLAQTPEHVAPTPEASEEWRRQQPEDMGDFEEKQEGLIMCLEHQGVGTRMWRNMIERNPSRLTGWKLGEHGTEGRLVNLGSQTAS